MAEFNTPMETWFLKVLNNHWRVFGRKAYYKTFAQSGHIWVRLSGSTWAPGARKRNYKCKLCGSAMNIILMAGRPKVAIFYKREKIDLSCEQLRMDEALR